ncbi:3-phosphoshikimate 1-carboxyvinyltransferase [Actinomyces sp. W5033]|uniref:3-phosphoshikimate 1-carboxyvinyltransferase n=1 Tax=Actinomyces sp. W5033 TaxID=3446479 RepID=UPI003EE0ED27
MSPVTSQDGLSAPTPDHPWAAPAATGPLNAVVTLPGSKSLTARALLLAALADTPTTLAGVLHSRDTELMRAALTAFGARFTDLDGDDGARLHVTPAPLPLHVATGPDGVGRIDCGLAGTVMRFIPPLVLLADAPVILDGDDGARLRPLAPLMEALADLGVGVTWLGEPGFLPIRLAPPTAAGPARGDVNAPAGALSPTRVSLDASASSQFLSALLLTGSLLPGGLAVTPTGAVPSLPHVAMTVAALRERGVAVDEPSALLPEGRRTWRVHPGRPGGGQVGIESDLSNAGPFLAAALVAGGTVSVEHWPASTTQAGNAWRALLPRLGGTVTTEPDGVGTLRLTCRGTGRIDGITADLSAVGELAPTVTALAVLASAQGHPSRLSGIAHLRGHETDRLAALVAEARRLGASARERSDGIEIDALPDGARLTPAPMRAYADHRMATFAALVGLAVPGTTLDDVACTSKTLPGFPALWEAVLAQGPDGHRPAGHRRRR